MTFPITSIFAASLALLMVALAFTVVMRRVKVGHSWGDGDDPSLLRAIRNHGNLAEYAPIFLFMMALLESQGADGLWLTVLGVTFAVSRVLYALYFAVKQALPLRIIGFWTSALPIAVGAVWLLLL